MVVTLATCSSSVWAGIVMLVECCSIPQLLNKHTVTAGRIPNSTD